MSVLPSYVVRWKWGLLAITAITVLSLMPQIHLWLVRTSQWQGAYATLQGDEFLYSAYINALIDGRPRRNDPAAGEDDHPQSPLPESLFSIQFIPPFVIAFLARAFGASASTSFIVLLGVAGLLASLSIFWLLVSVTGDNKFAAVGVLVVMCFGASAGGQGLLGLHLNPDTAFFGLPFLRRYLPSAPFPLFFVFCTFCWQALTTATRRTATMKALLAGTTFGVLIFSYFYLWTAAAAWLACFVFYWILARRNGRRSAARLFIIIGTLTALPLVFYAYLIAQRSSNSNTTQFLSLTRQPDLLRIPEIIGAFVLVVLIVGLWRDKLSRNQPAVIFAASVAFLPFLVFNQQVVTGRSLQPYHYEIFVANYAALIGLVVTAKLLLQAIPRRTLLLIASLCLLWGTMEVTLPFQAQITHDIKDDEMVPVLLRLKELAKFDGTWDGLRIDGKTPALVFSPQTGIMRLLPTWAPQGSSLEMGSVSFQSLSRAERKNELYLHLYYCGKNMSHLRELLNENAHDSYMAYHARSTIFGPERVVPFIGRDFQPIRQDEVEREVRAFETFTESFSREEVLKRPVSYMVTLAESVPDFSRIDRWYDRDGGERVGSYTLYRLRLRK